MNKKPCKIALQQHSHFFWLQTRAKNIYNSYRTNVPRLIWITQYLLQ